MASATCSVYPDNCGNLLPNADIAGIGVYVSFIASALLTIIASICLILCELRIKKESDTQPPSTPNLSDSLAASMKRRPGRRWEPLSAYNPELSFISRRSALILSKMLKPLILGFADQQLITGLAVLIAALASWETISGYHLNIVVNLAWFSCFTHVVALFSLEDFIRRFRVLLGLRLVGFLAVFVLFVFAQSKARDFVSGLSGGYIVQRGIFYGAKGGSCPAQCSAMFLPYSGIAHQFRIAVILVTVLGVCTTWAGRGRWPQPLVFMKIRLCLVAPLMKAMGLVLWLVAYGVLIYGLGSGIAAAISLRSPGDYPGVQIAANFGEQDSWTFGQLVAVILLVLPFLSALEGFLDARAEVTKDRKQDEDPALDF